MKIFFNTTSNSSNNMYSKDVYDKLMNEVLKSNEYAMKKLLKYLKDKSLEEIVID